MQRIAGSRLTKLAFAALILQKRERVGGPPRSSLLSWGRRWKIRARPTGAKCDPSAVQLE
jgi:hypothetical protein